MNITIEQLEVREFMYREQEILLCLINNAIHPSKFIEIENRNVDWKRVFDYANSQHLLPVIVNEASKIANVKNEEYFKRYNDISLMTVLGQAKRTEYFLQIYKKFIENGIHPIVMKGIICRKIYQKYANHRASSDEDILIKKENFNAVKSILEENGYVCEKSDITVRQLEEIQEVTFRNDVLGLSIEVHVNAIGHENAIRDTMNKYFEDAFVTGIVEEFTNSKRELVEVFTMNDTDHFLFLVLHAFKHFTFYGFGLRQCMDILLFQEKKGKNIDWELIKKSLTEVGAVHFFADIQWIGNTYLGFENPLMDSINCPQDLLEDLLLNGIFGNETQAQRTAEGLTSAVVSVETEKTHLLKRWIYTIFPQKERMLYLHPELVEKPWLLPICWIKRLFRLLLHNKDSEGKLLSESIKISNRRVALLRKYKVVSK